MPIGDLIIPGRLRRRVKQWLNTPAGLGDVLSTYLMLTEENRDVWRSRGAREIYRIGNYCEFGVMNGTTMIGAWRTLVSFYGGAEKVPDYWRLFGFDSFEGLPASADPADAHRYAGAGAYASRGVEQVAARLVSAGVPRHRFSLIPGFFEDSLNERTWLDLRLDFTTFVHIDCDFFSSTSTVLRAIEGRLQSGSLFYVDDVDYYQYNPHKGNLRAIREFNEADDSRGLAPAARFDRGSGHAYMFWRQEEIETEGIVWQESH